MTVAEFPPFLSADERAVRRIALGLPAFEVPAPETAPYDEEEEARDLRLSDESVAAYAKPRIEEEAHDLVFGDRQAAYGHPSSDFTATGRIVAAILSRWLESEGLAVCNDRRKMDDNSGLLFSVPVGPVRMPDIRPEIVALIMTAVKLSRESAHPKRDNRVDLIGYILCEDRIVEGEPDE